MKHFMLGVVELDRGDRQAARIEIRRALDLDANSRTPRNVALFLGANLVLRREIYRRQGMPLGTHVQLPVRPGPVVDDLYRHGHESHAVLSGTGSP